MPPREPTSSTPPEGAAGRRPDAVLLPDDLFDAAAATVPDSEKTLRVTESTEASPVAAETPTDVPPSTTRTRHADDDPDPVQIPDHRYRRGRRVVRVVRRVQLWSVFKIALIGNTILFAVCMAALALLWSFASAAGQIHHIEKFMRDIGFDDWTFDGGVLFPAALGIGAVLAATSTVMLTLAAAVMNLVSELTGGLRFTVIEELGTEED